MPTVHRERGFRFHFFSDERQEPPHVHVQNGGAEAKVWLLDGSIEYHEGLSAPQLRVLREIIAASREEMLKAWNEYHGEQASEQNSGS